MFHFVNIDKTNIFWCTLDTQEFIENTCGQPLDYEDQGRWMAQQETQIIEYLKKKTGKNYKNFAVGNPYNGENDLSSVFQMMFLAPEDSRDYLYDDELYVAVEIHQGGDVRGNYGPVKVYGPIYDGSYLLNYVLEWQVHYADGTETLESEEGQFQGGWAQHPLSHLMKFMKQEEVTQTFGQEVRKITRPIEPKWSERHQAFVGWYKDGRAVKITAYFYGV